MTIAAISPSDLVITDLLLQFVRLLLELVVLADDLFVSQVLHVLVNSQVHQHVQLSLAKYQQHEHEDCYQHYVYKKYAHIVTVTCIQNPVGTVQLLKPVNVENIKPCVKKDLSHYHSKKETLGFEIVFQC